eukprot:CAMPEP_0170634914 /NCGR_PEP_ID=MMETSP0224-20130122/36909_1 /TAXON_ID=285029 /ORGANISM="Togula jolla, Strain CCCM 725" /LENGTH=113 /DNA_ID=CAMNT_0010964313 /DNA_START=61 /DNA_END=402 /DNA_ORIENTATION=-
MSVVTAWPNTFSEREFMESSFSLPCSWLCNGASVDPSIDPLGSFSSGPSGDTACFEAVGWADAERASGRESELSSGPSNDVDVLDCSIDVHAPWAFSPNTGGLQLRQLARSSR